MAERDSNLRRTGYETRVALARAHKPVTPFADSSGYVTTFGQINLPQLALYLRAGSWTNTSEFGFPANFRGVSTEMAPPAVGQTPKSRWS